MKEKGKYLMMGSSAFFVLGIPAGVLLNDWYLIVTEAVVGLFFFLVGFAVYKKTGGMGD